MDAIEIFFTLSVAMVVFGLLGVVAVAIAYLIDKSNKRFDRQR